MRSLALRVFGPVLLSVFAATLTYAEAPQKIALVLAAGGSPGGATTQFDSSTVDLLNRLKEAKYDTDLAFDGGHEASEKIMKGAYGKTPDSFTLDSARQKTDQLVKRISILKPGDQVMVALNTRSARAQCEGGTLQNSVPIQH